MSSFDKQLDALKGLINAFNNYSTRLKAITKDLNDTTSRLEEMIQESKSERLSKGAIACQ